MPALFVATLLVVLCPAPGSAQDALRGVALVIGNGEYAHLAPLANPPDDADAIEELLSDLGFDSVRRSDRDAEDLARDLERFVEDAEDADVAILYYAGHGIEAGGENWLVPVDADASSLQSAARTLVPVSGVIRRLRETVPVTIILLDACRDSPFPPNATLVADAGGEPLPVTAGGLSEPGRGAAPTLTVLNRSAGNVENLGTVIGFAAAPGQVALDGKPGDNSPYAAALIRHISAMAGEEFGTVMRMVAEEVYLKTSGAQRPWVNESLRRLLYFGEAPDPVEGGEGDILTERRGLLLTIATLPDVQRRQAETLARGGNVPLSVVYAMMRALNVDPADDPTNVEARLRSELARFAENRAARDALLNPDAEIQRLTGLADQAELEGALNAANDFRDQAKQRVASLRGTRQDQVAALRQRILEDAEVYARSAETKTLLFRHAEAARDFGEARAIVADWDAGRAAGYRRDEIDAYLIDAELRGSASSLDAAENAAQQALADVPPPTGRDRAAYAHALARVVLLRTARSGDNALLEKGLVRLQEALAAAPREDTALRARILLDTGRAAGQLALASGNMAALENADDYFARAAEAARQTGDAAIRAEAEFRGAQAVFYLWSSSPDAQRFAELQTRLMALFSWMQDEDIDPLAARYLVRVGEIGLDLATRRNTPDAFRTAVEINETAASMFDPQRYPLINAETRYLAGRIGLEWAERFGDYSQLHAALENQEAALKTFREAGSLARTTDMVWQKALVLAAIGTHENGTGNLESARSELAALKKQRPDMTAQQLRGIDFQLARVEAAIAVRESDGGKLTEAVRELRRLHESASPTQDLAARTQIGAELGKAAYWLAGLSPGDAGLRDAVGLLGEAVAQYAAWDAPRANPLPYAELYQYYAGAAADLAIATASPGDIDRAVAANDDFRGQLAALGNPQAAANAANTAAYMLAQSLRIAFDDDKLTRAERLSAEALAQAGAMPELAGYFRNTACEIETEKARARADAALARSALANCRKALATLEKHNRTDAIPTARESVERAQTLVDELGG